MTGAGGWVLGACWVKAWGRAEVWGKAARVHRERCRAVLRLWSVQPTKQCISALSTGESLRQTPHVDTYVLAAELNHH